jgi:UDP-N-acetylglucosamine 1-carboxyvinyltransferase
VQSVDAMSSFRILGGTPLEGTVEASGSKNAALPIMAASILAEEPVRLERIPQVDDVRTLAEVLAELGVRTEVVDGMLQLTTVDPTAVRARFELVRRMRASFCVLGPLLARRREAVVSLPGGCNIGPRPIDLHLKGLTALGAKVEIQEGYVVARADRLYGADIDLSGPRGPTVTGTANVLSAAVLAHGGSVIEGAATEPEIVELGEFLRSLGARIEGLGTRTLYVTGVEQLGGTTHRIGPDRIEAGTLLLAAAITGGRATVTGIVSEHLHAVLQLLHKAGFTIQGSKDRVTLTSHGRPKAVNVTAQPYPGIPTDLQAQWTAMLTLAGGSSMIRDRVFPGRFAHVDELNRLGARIELADSTAMVTGVECLTGAHVTASDLRASAALVLAGLAAKGRTVVHHIEHLDRGYQRLDQKLARLGARIERLPTGRRRGRRGDNGRGED